MAMAQIRSDDDHKHKRGWESFMSAARVRAHDGSVYAIVAVPGTPYVVSGGSDKQHAVKIWNINTAPRTQTPLAVLQGHSRTVRCLAIMPVPGTQRFHLVSAGEDGNLFIYPLSAIIAGLDSGSAPAGKTVAFKPSWLLSHPDGSAKAAAAHVPVSASPFTLKQDGFDGMYESHEGGVRAVCVHEEDGKVVLISGSRDGRIRLWDLGLGNLKDATRLTCTTIHRSAHNRTSQYQVQAYHHSDTIVSLAVGASREGRSVILSGSKDMTAKIWLASGQLLHTLTGHEDSVLCVAIPAGGSVAVTGSGDNMLKTWDISTGSLLHTMFGHTDWVRNVQPILRGEESYLLSVGQDQTIRIWDVRSGEHIHRYKGPHHPIKSAAQVDDHTDVHQATRVVCGMVNGELFVQNMAVATAWRALKDGEDLVHLDAVVTAVSVDHYGEYAASGDSLGRVAIWTLSTGEPVMLSDPNGRRQGLAHEFQTVNQVDIWQRDLGGSVTVLTVASDGLLKVWLLTHHLDLADVISLAPFGQNNPPPLKALATANTGLYNFIYTCSRSQVACWRCPVLSEDVSPNKPQSLRWRPEPDVILNVPDLTYVKAAENSALCIAASPNGEYVAVGMADSSILVWKLRGWSLETNVDFDGSLDVHHVLEGHEKEVRSLAIVDKEAGTPFRLLSGSRDHTLKVWNLEKSGAALQTLVGHQGPVNSVKVTLTDKQPDKVHFHNIISASSDKTVRVWRLETSELVRTLIGHDKAVTTADVTPDGNHIVSGSHDNRVQVWDLANRLLSNVVHDYEYLTRCRRIGQTHDEVRQRTTLLRGALLESSQSVWETESGGIGVKRSTLLMKAAQSGDVDWVQELLDVRVGTFRFTNSPLDAFQSADARSGLYDTRVSWSSQQVPRWPVRTTLLGAPLPGSHTKAIELIADKLVEARKSADLVRMNLADPKDEEAAWQLTMADFEQELWRIDRPRGKRSICTTVGQQLTKDLINFCFLFPEQAARFLSEFGLLLAAERVDFGCPEKEDPKDSGWLRRFRSRSYKEANDNAPPVPDSPAKVARFQHAMPMPRSGMIVRAAEEYDELSFWQKRRRDGDIPQPPGVGSFSTLRRTESRVVVFPYAAGYLPPHLSVLPDGSVCSSLLDCVVRTGVPELFDNATIRAVIQFKWSTHVSSVFMFRFIVYIIALAGLLAMPFLMQPRSPVDQPTTPRRLATMVIAVVVGLLALYDGYHELLQIIKDVRTRNHGFVTSMKRYIFDFWNARDVVQLWLTGLAIGFYFAFGDSPTTRRPLSLAIYCKAVGLLYFLQAYHDTGTIVHIIISVIHDIRWFLFVLAVILMGTIFAFFALFINNSDVVGPGFDYTNVGTTTVTMYDLLILNNVNLEPMLSSEYQVITLAMFILSVFAVSIILLNLLVALLTDSYERIQERSSITFQMLRARMILDQELHFRVPWTLPSFLKPIFGPKIGSGGMDNGNGTNPKYLQVLVPKGEATHPAAQVWSGLLDQLRSCIISQVKGVEDELKVARKTAVSDRKNSQAEIAQLKLQLREIKEALREGAAVAPGSFRRQSLGSNERSRMAVGDRRHSHSHVH